MFNIYTVFPRGFCAGVNRAVTLLDEVIKTYGTPVYVNHEIIHNKFIIQYFKKKGVIFTDDITSIPEGNIVVVSAHGVGPSFFETIREKKLRFIDATCPLVEKVHKEAVNFIKEGYHIIYIGQKNHQEALGVIDYNPDKITIVTNREDIEHIKKEDHKKYALLTQTTLSVDDTKELISFIEKKFEGIVLPKAGDICYATTNRQNAIKKLIEKVDTVFIVGSENSSNSNKLKHTAKKLGKKAYLIDDETKIQDEHLVGAKNIGVSSGASGPEEIVQNIVQYLEKKGGTFIKEIKVVEEKVHFPYTITIKE